MTQSSNPPVFCFQSHQIRTTVDGNQVWFVAKDVCAVLGIAWSGATLKGMPPFWVGMMKLNTPQTNQALRVISEPAVYKLAFRSNKPEADAFTNWVAEEVLPSIRKTGQYEAKPQQLALPEVQSKELHNIKDANFIDHRVLKNLGDFWASISNNESGQCWKKICTYFQIADISELPKELLADATKFVQDQIVTRAKKNLLAQARQEEQEAQKRIVKALPAPEFTYHQRCAAVGERMLDLRIQAARVSKEMMFVLSNPFWGLPGTIPEDKRAFTDAMNYAIQSYSTSTIKSLEIVDLLFKAYVEGKKIIHQ